LDSLVLGPLEIKNEKSTGLGNWGTIRIIQTCVKVGEVLDSGDWSQNFHESRNFGVLEDKKNGGDSKSLQVAYVESHPLRGFLILIIDP